MGVGCGGGVWMDGMVVVMMVGYGWESRECEEEGREAVEGKQRVMAIHHIHPGGEGGMRGASHEEDEQRRGWIMLGASPSTQ